MDHSAEQTRGSPILPEHADLQRRRRAAMAVLAESEAAEIARRLDSIGRLPRHEELRAAESGLLMVRGRMGGDGAPFNIGEATVTRAAVKLESGETGFGYVLGRDHAKARLVALCDALVQTTIYRNVVEREVVAPIRDRLDAAREHKAQQIAATKVEFFTLVRGED
jgi:alpha-D-ribose 1-methylphosphonate 5-triphosphate synthase subunit PhnG